MTLQLHFNTFVKNNQTRKLSKTWHTMITDKEVARNNYLATGNIRKAKQFAVAVRNFQFKPVTLKNNAVEPTVIFSKDMLDTDFSLLTYLA